MVMLFLLFAIVPSCLLFPRIVSRHMMTMFLGVLLCLWLMMLVHGVCVRMVLLLLLSELIRIMGFCF